MSKLTIEGIGEIDEEDLRASVKLRNTVGAWMKNPASRRKMLEAHKTYDPKADIPELDQPDPLEAKINPLTADIAALRKEIADRDAKAAEKESLTKLESSIEAGFKKLRETEGVTVEGEAAIRKVMDEKGTTDPEMAYAYLLRTHPPQDLVTPGGSSVFNFLDTPVDTDADVKALIAAKGEDSPVVNKMIREALTEFRSGMVRR